MLIVTIIILIILALIGIQAVFGESGLISMAEKAAEQQIESSIKEKLERKLAEDEIKSIGSDDETTLNIWEIFKGIYRLEENGNMSEEIIHIKIDGIIEDNDKLYRCTVYFAGIGNDISELKVENVSKVSEIDPMAEPIVLLLSEKKEEVEILDTEKLGDAVGIIIKYKEKKYIIYESFIMDGDNIEADIWIEEYNEENITTQKWKYVYVGDSSAYAIDNNENLWVWNSTNYTGGEDITSITSSNANMYNLSIKNKTIKEVYGGMVTDRQYLSDTDGKVYSIVNERNQKSKITCLNDLYSELNNIKAIKIGEAGKGSGKYSGKLVYILDENKKIWALNTEQATMNLISDNNNFTDLIDGYSNCMAIDSEGKLWGLYEDTVINISEGSSLQGKRVKSVENAYDEYIALTENNQLILIEGNTISNLTESNTNLSNIIIKEYKRGGYIIDTENNIYFYNHSTGDVTNINNLGLCDGKKINNVYGAYLIDEEGVLWRRDSREFWGITTDKITVEKITEELKGKTLTKVFAEDVFMGIDSEGNLYKYGTFIYPN